MRVFKLITGRGALCALAIASLGGCIKGRESPDVPTQANVGFGPKLFLSDETRSLDQNVPVSTVTICNRRGASFVNGADEPPTIQALDSGGPILKSTLHNCYIEVEPNTLKVDQIEVTNELYQLCVDSGACTAVERGRVQKKELCDDEVQFDICPVLGTSQSQAETFCRWIGRRLPTGIEHIIARQAGSQMTQEAESILAFPIGRAPTACAEVLAGSPQCPLPRSVIRDDRAAGAVPLDSVTGVENEDVIFNLMGNTAEWSSNRLLRRREDQGLAGYPWFCQAPLETINPPTCPSGAVCVRGQYKPSGYPLRSDWPVCVAFHTGRSSPPDGSAAVSEGAVFGGSYRDSAITPQLVGTFSRAISVHEADESPGLDSGVGFRCSGDRLQGSEFEDLPVLR